MESFVDLSIKKKGILGQQKNNINILLVEDDYVSQLIISGMCKIAKWNLFVASSGREALKILESKDFNIILMDIQMHEMSGIEVAKVIREDEQLTGEHIPIIATTAFSTNQDRLDVINAGMDAYINKPIDLAKLEKLILEYAK